MELHSPPPSLCHFIFLFVSSACPVVITGHPHCIPRQSTVILYPLLPNPVNPPKSSAPSSLGLLLHDSQLGAPTNDPSPPPHSGLPPPPVRNSHSYTRQWGCGILILLSYPSSSSSLCLCWRTSRCCPPTIPTIWPGPAPRASASRVPVHSAVTTSPH